MWNTTADAFAKYLRAQNVRGISTGVRKQKSQPLGLAADFRGRRTFQIRFDFVEMDAEFLYTPMAEEMALPHTGMPVTLGKVVTWDGGLYVHTDKEMPLCDARTEVAPGQIVYCADPQAFAIPFGRRPMPRDEERRRERRCESWARLLGDVRSLARVKDGATITMSRYLPFSQRPKWLR
jgi:hypothetical protein